MTARNTGRMLAFIVAAVWAAVLALCYIYRANIFLMYPMMAVSGVMAVIFLIVGINSRPKVRTLSDAEIEILPGPKITELVLLNEDDEEVASWELFGKIGLVIGKDVGENRVDVNLAHATYASMVDIEHAVLNYSAEAWHVEDLHSKNGVCIQKSADSRKYKIDPGSPCRLDAGDVIFVGMTRLLIQ